MIEVVLDNLLREDWEIPYYLDNLYRYKQER